MHFALNFVCFILCVYITNGLPYLQREDRPNGAQHTKSPPGTVSLKEFLSAFIPAQQYKKRIEQHLQISHQPPSEINIMKEVLDFIKHHPNSRSKFFYLLKAFCKQIPVESYQLGLLIAKLKGVDDSNYKAELKGDYLRLLLNIQSYIESGKALNIFKDDKKYCPYFIDWMLYNKIEDKTTTTPKITTSKTTTISTTHSTTTPSTTTPLTTTRSTTTHSTTTTSTSTTAKPTTTKPSTTTHIVEYIDEEQNSDPEYQQAQDASSPSNDPNFDDTVDYSEYDDNNYDIKESNEDEIVPEAQEIHEYILKGSNITNKRQIKKQNEKPILTEENTKTDDSISKDEKEDTKIMNHPTVYENKVNIMKEMEAFEKELEENFKENSPKDNEDHEDKETSPQGKDFLDERFKVGDKSMTMDEIMNFQPQKLEPKIKKKNNNGLIKEKKILKPEIMDEEDEDIITTQRPQPHYESITIKDIISVKDPIEKIKETTIKIIENSAQEISTTPETVEIKTKKSEKSLNNNEETTIKNGALEIPEIKTDVKIEDVPMEKSLQNVNVEDAKNNEENKIKQDDSSSEFNNRETDLASAEKQKNKEATLHIQNNPEITTVADEKSTKDYPNTKSSEKSSSIIETSITQAAGKAQNIDTTKSSEKTEDSELTMGRNLQTITMILPKKEALEKDEIVQATEAPQASFKMTEMEISNDEDIGKSSNKLSDIQEDYTTTKTSEKSSSIIETSITQATEKSQDIDTIESLEKTEDSELAIGRNLETTTIILPKKEAVTKDEIDQATEAPQASFKMTETEISNDEDIGKSLNKLNDIHEGEKILDNGKIIENNTGVEESNIVEEKISGRNSEISTIQNSIESTEKYIAETSNSNIDSTEKAVIETTTV